MKPLPLAFYARDTAVVAQELLGKVLVRKLKGKILSGKIVETEAYFQDDPASHAFRRMTPRNRPMYEAPGQAYVYFIYGNHYCLNVVTEKPGIAGAVLIRALEPLEGIEEMQKNRGSHDMMLLTRGPGRLTEALKINHTFNRADLRKGNVLIVDGSCETFKIEQSPRIGISKASKALLRFSIRGNPFVSR